MAFSHNHAAIVQNQSPPLIQKNKPVTTRTAIDTVNLLRRNLSHLSPPSPSSYHAPSIIIVPASLHVADLCSGQLCYPPEFGIDFRKTKTETINNIPAARNRQTGIDGWRQHGLTVFFFSVQVFYFTFNTGHVASCGIQD
jgi:hypothetical protein